MNNPQSYYCEPKYIAIKTTLWLSQSFQLYVVYSRNSESILNNQSSEAYIDS